jgi:hypothetical protein
MKHCYILLFITLSLLYTFCKQQTEHNANELQTIDFEQCFDSETQMAISEIADYVEYVELKTPEDVIITRIWNVKQIDSFLLIQARWDVYLFRKDGQFIRQIGSHGQGPGEYLTCSDVEIDRKKRELIIADTEKLLFYDLDGNFLHSKKLKGSYIGLSDTILWISKIATYEQKNKAVAVLLSDPGDTLACIPNPVYGKTQKTGTTAIINSSLMEMFYHKNNSLYFKGDESNDTIWKLSGVQAEPYVFIYMGKYKLPLEFEAWYSSYDTYIKNHERYWAVSILVEDEHYFFLLSQNKKSNKENRVLKYIIYDKKQEKGFSVKDSKGMGLTDDILGGPPVWAHWISDEYYIDAITAEGLLEKVKSGDFTPPSPLKEQLSRMNGESNDLIILCRRKKLKLL